MVLNVVDLLRTGGGGGGGGRRRSTEVLAIVPIPTYLDLWTSAGWRPPARRTCHFLSVSIHTASVANLQTDTSRRHDRDPLFGDCCRAKSLSGEETDGRLDHRQISASVQLLKETGHTSRNKFSRYRAGHEVLGTSSEQLLKDSFGVSLSCLLVYLTGDIINWKGCFSFFKVIIAIAYRLSIQSCRRRPSQRATSRPTKSRRHAKPSQTTFSCTQRWSTYVIKILANRSELF